MKVTERKLGRIFHLQFERGDHFYGQLNPFVKEKNIRSASIFIFGAMDTLDMITGFKSMQGYDVDRRHFDDRRASVSVRQKPGNIKNLGRFPQVRGFAKSCRALCHPWVRGSKTLDSALRGHTIGLMVELVQRRDVCLG